MDMAWPAANTLFIVGTLAYVREIAVVQDVPGVEHGGFGDLDAPDGNDGPATDPEHRGTCIAYQR